MYIKRDIEKTKKVFFRISSNCLNRCKTKYPNPETLEVGALSGAIFETFVVNEVIKNLTNNGVNPQMCLYYYRDKDQKEIDLIYVEGDVLFPIEIKKGISPNCPR